MRLHVKLFSCNKKEMCLVMRIMDGNFQQLTNDKIKMQVYNLRCRNGKGTVIPMEKQKRKKKTCPKLGARAKKLLVITLPLVLIQAVYTVAFAAGLDTYEMTASIDTIRLLLEQIGMSLMLSVVGSLFFDMVEKREKGKE